MSVIVVDTDVASRILKSRLPADLESELDGHALVMGFVTVGELTKWTLVRKWGPNRLNTLSAFMLRVGVLPYDRGVARKRGALQAASHLMRFAMTDDAVSAWCESPGFAATRVAALFGG